MTKTVTAVAGDSPAQFEEAARNEAFRGVLIVVFSILLIPAGLAAIGGWDALSGKVDPADFALLTGSGIAFWELAGIWLISIVQIHGIHGIMGIAGSARNEFAARPRGRRAPRLGGVVKTGP
jgi:solute:Na+ symporter, SSS family